MAHARPARHDPAVRAGGIRLGRPTAIRRRQLLAAATRQTLTYAFVRSTLETSGPERPALRSIAGDVGRGASDFAAARGALQAWVPQRALGATVEPAGVTVVPGTTVLIVLALGPVCVIAPNRIVAVVDEPRRYAFAYGTLPGHPERGEESFTVEHLADDTVRVTIRVQARLSWRGWRIVDPLARLAQALTLRRYRRAVAAAVRA